MREEDRKQRLSQVFQQQKNPQPKVLGFSEITGLRWKERTGKDCLVAICGHVQALEPVGFSWVTTIDLESCFSFFTK